MTTQTPHVLEQLSLYLDHALSAADQVAVKSHLNECAPCRRRSEQMIQLRQSLKQTETLAPPESFYQGVLARIESKASEKRHLSWSFSAKALVSACLVFIAVWVSRDSIFPPRPTSPVSDVVQGKAASSADQFAAAPGAALAPKKVETVYERQDTSGIIAHDALKQKDQEMILDERAEESPVRNEKKMLFKSIKPIALQSTRARQPASAGAVISASAKEDRPGLEMEWHGHDSAITLPREFVARNLAEWQAFWSEHTHQKFEPAPPLPAVDFTRFMVVGVFLGNRGSGGYSAQIVSVQETGMECVVLYREIVPPEDSVQTMDVTQPFHLKVVPQSRLPLHFQKL